MTHTQVYVSELEPVGVTNRKSEAPDSTALSTQVLGSGLWILTLTGGFAGSLLKFVGLFKGVWPLCMLSCPSAL